MLTENHRAERGHDFYPPAVGFPATPRLYATVGTPAVDEVIRPALRCTRCGTDWWNAELDPDTGLAFGYARLAGDDRNA